MNQELFDEINYEIQLLLKSGFYSEEEIIEIIDDEFIGENISEEFISDILSRVKEDFGSINCNSEDFIKLKKSFSDLTKRKIISIHNAGYDVKEGIQDSFELFAHLSNNNYAPEGFCFYTFEDIETVIEDNVLNIAFGDFEYNESKCLAIGKIVKEVLLDNRFNISWDESADNMIKIKDFVWLKSFDDVEYSMDGALEDFINVN